MRATVVLVEPEETSQDIRVEIENLKKRVKAICSRSYSEVLNAPSEKSKEIPWGKPRAATRKL